MAKFVISSKRDDGGISVECEYDHIERERTVETFNSIGAVCEYLVRDAGLMQRPHQIVELEI